MIVRLKGIKDPERLGEILLRIAATAVNPSRPSDSARVPPEVTI